jgi:hypothetical protein
MAEEMAEVRILDFVEFENRVRELARERGIKIVLDFVLSKGAYYRCEAEVYGWNYRGLYNSEGERNFNSEGFAESSEDTTDSFVLSGYTNVEDLLTDVYREILYIINTIDRVKEREKLFNRRIKLEL